MAFVIPPRPPVVVAVDDDGLRRVHFRLWQIVMTMATVLLTTWFCTFGVLPAILALMVAKHVLVAILVRGFDLPAPRVPEQRPLPTDAFLPLESE